MELFIFLGVLPMKLQIILDMNFTHKEESSLQQVESLW